MNEMKKQRFGSAGQRWRSRFHRFGSAGQRCRSRRLRLRLRLRRPWRWQWRPSRGREERLVQPSQCEAVVVRFIREQTIGVSGREGRCLLGHHGFGGAGRREHTQKKLCLHTRPVRQTLVAKACIF